MTKPRREPGAARQWGVINNILKSSSHGPLLKELTGHPDQARDGRGASHANGGDEKQSRLSHTKHHDQSRTLQHSSRSGQSAFNQQDQYRSHSFQRPSTPHSDRHSDRSYHRAERGRDYRRRSWSPQTEQQHSQSRAQKHATQPVGESREMATTSTYANNKAHSKQPSSRNHKRTLTEDSNDAERTAKKQRINLHSVERIKQSLHRARVEQKTVAPKSKVTATTSIVKSQHHREPEIPTSLPTLPPSNRSSEHRSSSEQTSNTKCISTPNSIEKTRSNQTTPLLPIGFQYVNSKKRQLDEDVDFQEELKRLRQPKASKPTKSVQRSSVGPPLLLRQPSHAPWVKSCAVRPESSFAPVIPNPVCELNFLDYLHDSVPILYSSMITHSPNADFLNSPSGTLIVDALAVIAPSVDPLAKRGWPSAIEVPGRKPSATNPFRVVSDVDLYLHKNGSELCVATDRGLIAVTTYLELIGVPKRQPVRFEGCVPSWARMTFRAPEKRRIVWPEKHNAGKTEIVPKYTAIGTNQLTLTLQAHVDVEEERANLEAWEEQVRREKETKPVPSLVQKTSGSKEGQEEKAKLGEIKTLTAEPGELPLRAGSVVLVYAVDDEEKWAYGRLSGTNKMGRIPMEFTCPLDWSLDRFAATSNALNEPLKKSEDVSERDWRGLYHWVRQQGYAFGPTWKQTVEAGVAKARDDKAKTLAANKFWMRSETSLTPAVPNARSDQATSQKAPSDKQSPALATIASAATVASTATVTSTTSKGEQEEAMPVVSSLSIDGDAGSSPVGGDQGKTPIEDTSKIELKINTLSKPHQIERLGASAKSSKDKQQEREGFDVGGQEPGEVEYTDKMVEVESNSAHVLTEQELGDMSAGSYAPTKVESPDAENAGVDRVAEREPMEEEARAITETSETPAHENPFSKPRLDLWARNDDIEYDYGDSEDEL